METHYYKLSAENPSHKVIEVAGALLRQGGLVAFPTETVYGLGANGYSPEAVAAIYAAKGRPSDNPLILHIASLAMLDELVTTVPVAAEKALQAFWPGPLTIIAPKSSRVPLAVTGGLDTVAVRYPSSVIARELIAAANVPIAAPSANRSGKPSPTTAQAVLEDLDGRIDMIIDGGPCDIGLESTVLDCTGDIPVILRPGGITYEMLVQELGQVEVDPGLSLGSQAAPKAPGMKYRHYAPTAPLILFEGPEQAVQTAMQERVAQETKQGRRLGLLICEEWRSLFQMVESVETFGSLLDLDAVAGQIFGALRSFDHESVDLILAQGIPESGIGRAVMNRLRKAAGQQIVKV
ncbi:MAG: L-threonylcarbamoyladenylate synthase [Sporomusaceae bacterium]|nr:L-threonylcarbamoyladenylate synthase [Sporomusaceae bacterium]